MPRPASRMSADTGLDGTYARLRGHPQQIEGPYFADEQLHWADIRSDPAAGSVKPGVLLRLVLTVLGVTGRPCTPQPGAAVDIWDGDALGTHSDVLDWLLSSHERRHLRFPET
jgi:protocatechuate 3,4-dioxygenase beta subunit